MPVETEIAIIIHFQELSKDVTLMDSELARFRLALSRVRGVAVRELKSAGVYAAFEK